MEGKSNMKYSVITMLLIVVGFATASAQTVTNVTAEQVDKTIHVLYDLDKQADITLFLSTDGGNTYTKLYRVSGDVGSGISAGHKTIIWDVLEEMEKFVGDNIVFKVKAEGAMSFTVNGVTFNMIHVKGGTFTMGCTSEQGSDCGSNENPSHSVTLSDFWMGETEVTQALWQAVMNTTVEEQRDKSNPSLSMRGEGASYPMYYVSWNEAVEFCDKLNSQLSGQLPSGYRFSLPSEAQWEYAARGGNKSRGYKYAGGNSIGDVAWYSENSSSATHTVKDKQANELGLYDMSGNVVEWCSDWDGSYSSFSQTNPTGSSTGSRRVLRGGSWGRIARHCRVSFREFSTPGNRISDGGFRLALVRQ